LPAHVVALGKQAIGRSRSQALRERWTHLLRVKYTRLLIHGMRHAKLYLSVVFALFLGAAAAVGVGLVKFQFFAFDPIRLYYVNVDMPPNAPIEETLRQTLQVEKRVRAGLREGEARSVTSLAGIKFTEMEPLYGDQYGQIAVSLNPARPGVRGLDDIIEGMRESVTQTPGRATISFLRSCLEKIYLI
jgi:multidrug efflux pump subunit AcrB